MNDDSLDFSMSAMYGIHSGRNVRAYLKLKEVQKLLEESEPRRQRMDSKNQWYDLGGES